MADWNGQQHFIMFIDDFLWYDHIYLLHEKSQSLEVFKNFNAKVENQFIKKIKSIRSDSSGEYYGRYDDSGEQRLRPYAKLLEECRTIL